MYSRTAAFDAAIVKSHKIATKVEVYSSGTLLQDISLNVIDGNITIDDTAVHRTCTISLTDATGALTPADISALLAPAGNEIKLYRGITYADGSVELLPQGMYGIYDLRMDDSGQGLHMEISAKDRAQKVSDAKFTTEYVVLAGTNYITAIGAILFLRYPAVATNFPTTALTTPQLVFEAGSDPWKAVTDMAASIGYDIYFDPNGVCIMVPVVLGGSTVWTYAEGSQATILYINRRLSRENTYNHVVYTGETSGVTTPVRAESVDNNPSSPTYYLGKFGDVVVFESSTFVTTAAQAQAAGDRKLAKGLGLAEMVEFNSIVHPAHEIGDLVQITRAKSKVNAVYGLTKITLPMVHDRPLIASCSIRTLT